MIIVSPFVLSLALILSSIDLSLEFECLPNGAPIPGVPRSGTAHNCSLSEVHHAPEKLPSAETSLRVRSRSPHPVRHRNLLILGYDLGNVGLLRLIPHTNPQRQFEIRRYTFPADKPIVLLGRGRTQFKPMPTKERYVLTTSTGDVLAMMEYHSMFRGIFNRDRKRMCINMESGAVFELTPELVNETPVGYNHKITNNYQVICLKHV